MSASSLSAAAAASVSTDHRGANAVSPLPYAVMTPGSGELVCAWWRGLKKPDSFVKPVKQLLAVLSDSVCASVDGTHPSSKDSATPADKSAMVAHCPDKYDLVTGT